MQISVKYLTSSNLDNLEVEPSDTIENVMNKIRYEIRDQPENGYLERYPHELRLNLRGERLEVSRTLSEYEIQTGSSLHLILMLDRNLVENVIEKYETHVILDNVSVEVGTYNVTNKLEEINAQQEESVLGQNNLSFIVHAAAIKFLYSPQITNRIAQKITDLRRNNVPNFDEIFNGIKLAADHVVAFQRELNETIVQNEIVRTINNDPEGFFRALGNRNLNDFFGDLITHYGYRPGNLLGWHHNGELGKLSISYAIPNIPFDVSQGTSNFYVDFFANLRLHNTRVKMALCNGEQLENITWIYSDSVTVQSQTILARLRRDMVHFRLIAVPSYDVISTLEELDGLHRVFSELFSDGVREISENAACLHYLLFGTEVMRNPSAIIHNMMILDLIQDGKLKWENVFVRNVMPMSMRGAGMASRIKNSKYKNYMPYKYLYENEAYEPIDGNYNSVKELIKNEKRLTVCWLFWKFGGECLEYLDDQFDCKIEWANVIFDKLQESCQGWYNIPFFNDERLGEPMDL